MNKKVVFGTVAGFVCVLIVVIFLIVKPSDEKVSVKFIVDGQQYDYKTDLDVGTLIKEPIPPTKDGYKFLGWYINGEPFDFKTQVKENSVLEAKFEKIEEEKVKYTITFNTDGGSSVADQVVEENKTITKPSNPTRNGYTFVGWYLNNKEYNFEDKVISDITLVAKWNEVKEESKPTEVKKYTITFNTDGGSYINKQIVNQNQKVSKPSNPTRNGYTFIGWYLNEKQFDFNTKITSNITLTAKWNEVKEESKPIEVKKYTITFNTEGGSSVADQVVEENKTITKPSNPTRNGYTFIGWYLNDKQFDFNTKITSNITLTAKWNLDKVSVSSIVLDKTSYSMNINTTLMLKATISPSNATDKNITWSSSNTNVATVSNGIITAKSSGTATITATVDGKSATCTITVVIPITYTYEIVDVPGSVTSQCYIYIKNSDGKYVSGTLTIKYTNGASETVNITSSGYMIPNKTAISTITNVKGS